MERIPQDPTKPTTPAGKKDQKRSKVSLCQDVTSPSQNTKSTATFFSADWEASSKSKYACFKIIRPVMTLPQKSGSLKKNIISMELPPEPVHQMRHIDLGMNSTGKKSGFIPILAAPDRLPDSSEPIIELSNSAGKKPSPPLSVPTSRARLPPTRTSPLNNTQLPKAPLKSSSVGTSLLPGRPALHNKISPPPKPSSDIKISPPTMPTTAPPPRRPKTSPPPRSTTAPPPRSTTAPPPRPTTAPPPRPKTAPPHRPKTAPPPRPTTAPPPRPKTAPPTRPTTAPPPRPKTAPPQRPTSDRKTAPHPRLPVEGRILPPHRPFFESRIPRLSRNSMDSSAPRPSMTALDSRVPRLSKTSLDSCAQPPSRTSLDSSAPRPSMTALDSRIPRLSKTSLDSCAQPPSRTSLDSTAPLPSMTYTDRTTPIPPPPPPRPVLDSRAQPPHKTILDSSALLPQRPALDSVFPPPSKTYTDKTIPIPPPPPPRPVLDSNRIVQPPPRPSLDGNNTKPSWYRNSPPHVRPISDSSAPPPSMNDSVYNAPPLPRPFSDSVFPPKTLYSNAPPPPPDGNTPFPSKRSSESNINLHSRPSSESLASVPPQLPPWSSSNTFPPPPSVPPQMYMDIAAPFPPAQMLFRQAPSSISNKEGLNTGLPGPPWFDSRSETESTIRKNTILAQSGESAYLAKTMNYGSSTMENEKLSINSNPEKVGPTVPATQASGHPSSTPVCLPAATSHTQDSGGDMEISDGDSPIRPPPSYKRTLGAGPLLPMIRDRGSEGSDMEISSDEEILEPLETEESLVPMIANEPVTKVSERKPQVSYLTLAPIIQAISTNANQVLSTIAQQVDASRSFQKSNEKTKVPKETIPIIARVEVISPTACLKDKSFQIDDHDRSMSPPDSDKTTKTVDSNKMPSSTCPANKVSNTMIDDSLRTTSKYRMTEAICDETDQKRSNIRKSNKVIPSTPPFKEQNENMLTGIDSSRLLVNSGASSAETKVKSVASSQHASDPASENIVTSNDVSHESSSVFLEKQTEASTEVLGERHEPDSTSMAPPVPQGTINENPYCNKWTPLILATDNFSTVKGANATLCEDIDVRQDKFVCGAVFHMHGISTENEHDDVDGVPLELGDFEALQTLELAADTLADLTMRDEESTRGLSGIIDTDDSHVDGVSFSSGDESTLAAAVSAAASGTCEISKDSTVFLPMSTYLRDQKIDTACDDHKRSRKLDPEKISPTPPVVMVRTDTVKDSQAASATQNNNDIPADSNPMTDPLSIILSKASIKNHLPTAESLLPRASTRFSEVQNNLPGEVYTEATTKNEASSRSGASSVTIKPAAFNKLVWRVHSVEKLTLDQQTNLNTESFEITNEGMHSTECVQNSYDTAVGREKNTDDKLMTSSKAPKRSRWGKKVREYSQEVDNLIVEPTIKESCDSNIRKGLDYSVLEENKEANGQYVQEADLQRIKEANAQEVKEVYAQEIKELNVQENVQEVKEVNVQEVKELIAQDIEESKAQEIKAISLTRPETNPGTSREEMKSRYSPTSASLQSAVKDLACDKFGGAAVEARGSDTTSPNNISSNKMKKSRWGPIKALGGPNEDVQQVKVLLSSSESAHTNKILNPDSLATQERNSTHKLALNKYPSPTALAQTNKKLSNKSLSNSDRIPKKRGSGRTGSNVDELHFVHQKESGNNTEVKAASNSKADLFSRIPKKPKSASSVGKDPVFATPSQSNPRPMSEAINSEDVKQKQATREQNVHFHGENNNTWEGPDSSDMAAFLADAALEQKARKSLVTENRSVPTSLPSIDAEPVILVDIPKKAFDSIGKIYQSSPEKKTAKTTKTSVLPYFEKANHDSQFEPIQVKKRQLFSAEAKSSRLDDEARIEPEFNKVKEREAIVVEGDSSKSLQVQGHKVSKLTKHASSRRKIAEGSEDEDYSLSSDDPFTEKDHDLDDGFESAVDVESQSERRFSEERRLTRLKPLRLKKNSRTSATDLSSPGGFGSLAEEDSISERKPTNQPLTQESPAEETNVLDASNTDCRKEVSSELEYTFDIPTVPSVSERCTMVLPSSRLADKPVRGSLECLQSRPLRTLVYPPVTMAKSSACCMSAGSSTRTKKRKRPPISELQHLKGKTRVTCYNRKTGRICKDVCTVKGLGNLLLSYAELEPIITPPDDSLANIVNGEIVYARQGRSAPNIRVLSDILPQKSSLRASKTHLGSMVKVVGGKFKGMEGTVEDVLTGHWFQILNGDIGDADRPDLVLVHANDVELIQQSEALSKPEPEMKGLDLSFLDFLGVPT